jgi:hypothetical protein
MNPILEQAMRLRFQKCLDTLNSKTKEYTTADDIFHNFNKASELMDVSPGDVLVSYSLKHFISIRDMIGKNIELPSPEKWDEKMGDFINYMLLLDFMMQERLKKEA